MKFCFIVLVFLSGVPIARAQRTIEISPFAGGRFGGKIDETSQANPSVDYLKIKNSENFGVLADFGVWDKIHFEFMWSRQPTSLSTHSPSSGALTYLSKMNLDTYTVGTLYQFREKRANLRPFISLTFGTSHFGASTINGHPVLGFTNRFGATLGGGVKYFFNRHIGIRSEVLWIESETTPYWTTCTYAYGPTYACEMAHGAEQVQANLGLIVRLR